MARRFPIALRIALFFSSLIVVLFCVFLAVVALELKTSLQNLNVKQFTDLANARADQIQETLDKVDTLVNAYTKLPQTMAGDARQIEGVLANSVQALPPEVAGLFFADSTGKSLMSSGDNVNVSDRDYFKAILKDNQGSFIGAPVISKSLHVPIIVVARAVNAPDGKIRGLLGAQVLLEKLSGIATAIKIGHSGYGWITDGNGTVIAHPEAKLVMNLNLGDSAKAGYRNLENFGKGFIAAFTGSGSWTQPDGKPMASYYALIKKTPGWHLILSLPAWEVSETADGILVILGLFLLGGIVVSMVLSLLLARAVSKPLKTAARQFRILAEGDADLTVKIPLKRNDEIGDLVRDFNAFIGKLHQIVSSVKTAQFQLREMGEELKASAQNSATAVQQISGQTSKVGNLVQKQGSSISESSAAIEEITKNIEFLDRLIGNQANEISQASAAIEQMIGNIASISSSIGKMSGEFGSLTVEAKEGRHRMDQTLKGIQLINERSSSLIEANKVIAGIAARTNLLAMNAAIEAAHAGEYGRGFSVVATEIRNLAENSALQSRAIAKEISEVRSTIEEMVETAGVTGESFAQVSRRVEGIEVLAREISLAMGEQNQASTQVLEALRGIKDGTFQVQNGSREMNAGNIMILKEMENLRDSSHSIHSGMGEMTEGTAHIHTAAQRVLEIATETHQTIESVENSVGRFKI